MEAMLTEMERQQYQEAIAAHRRRYGEVKAQLTNLGVGEYEIEVAEVLFVGVYMHDGPNTVIIRDKKGWVIEIPEAALQGGVLSRHSVREGMQFRIRVAPIPVVGPQNYVLKCETV